MNLSIANWKKGQRGAGVKAVDIESKVTKPPAPYTEGTLLAAMKGAAQFIADPALKAALKEAQGIGTPATRAAIIERLKEVDCLREERGAQGAKGEKYLRSTDKGRQVVKFLPRMLTDAGTTAVWEQMLELVSRGEMSLEDFMARQTDAVKKLVAEALAASHALPSTDSNTVPCAEAGCAGGGTLCKRRGKYGPYWACSIPGCTNKFDEVAGKPKLRKAPPPIIPLPGDGEPCKACKQGVMVTKQVNKLGSKSHGKKFLSCSRYPQCNHAEWP